MDFDTQLNGHYDAFSHLRQTLCLNGDSLLAMFSGLFDESGTHADASAVVVGGYVATAEDWQKFGQKWSILLSREHIKILHRVDLENFSGEFEGWKRDRQIKVIKIAHGIIKTCTTIGIGGSVVQADFDAVMPGVVKRAMGGAYGWLIQESMVGVAHWAAQSNKDPTVQYVFEAGAAGRHQVEHMISVLYDDPKMRQLLRIGGWSFQSKENLQQLQSADWFAYELYKQMDNRIVKGPRRAIRKSAWDLFRPEIDNAHYWDKTRLQKWVEKSGPVIKMFEEREKALLSIGRKDLI